MSDAEKNTNAQSGSAGAVAGVLAEFDSPKDLVAAAAKVRQEGFRRWDAHSPFPIHGLERAMGIRMTILPWLVLGAGISGGLFALVMQWWTNAVHYPLNISGKPLFSLPANIPVTFELIVLLSALTAFFGALALSALPQYWHGVFSSPRFKRATTDGFFISIDARDKKFDQTATSNFLESIGAGAVETCFDPATGREIPVYIKWGVLALAAIAVVPPLFVARMRVTRSSSPRIHLWSDMDWQPKYKAQTASPLFSDGRSNRVPVAGTIASGRLEDDDHFYLGKVEGEWATAFPQSIVNESMPESTLMSTMQRGQERFNVYCAVCHGLSGDGKGPVSLRAQQLLLKGQEVKWTPPTMLSVAQLLAKPVGDIFNTITNGKNTMPPYATQISAEDRWAIVMYVRALQRSRTATLDDVPEELRSKLP